MKILLDANLSWRLVISLNATFPNILHVERTGLPIPANDTSIWDWAKINGYIIITNDEDFLNLSIQKGFPPKVVLLRLGNQSTENITRVLIRYEAEIDLLDQDPNSGFLEIY